MNDEPPMAQIGALIGSPARSLMLTELFDGRALTATELSNAAGVSSATGSEHLAQLLSGGMVTRQRSGRHQYYRLASPDIAHALEQLVVQTTAARTSATGARKPRTPMQKARLCYDHIAGELGVKIADAFVQRGFLVARDSDYELTPAGEALFAKNGIDVQEMKKSKRIFARQCLDWSERRHHIAGIVGCAIAKLAFREGWISHTDERRVLLVTPIGQRELKARFGVDC